MGDFRDRDMVSVLIADEETKNWGDELLLANKWKPVKDSHCCHLLHCRDFEVVVEDPRSAPPTSSW